MCTISDPFKIVVDYSLYLSVMIALGGYDWKNDNICDASFPVDGVGKAETEVILVHFNRTMTTEQVLAEFERLGLRPGKIEELLAFGAMHPDVQREFPIVSLGSVWVGSDGNRHCAYLGGSGHGRDLCLVWDGGGGWGERDRFLAIRK